MSIHRRALLKQGNRQGRQAFGNPTRSRKDRTNYGDSATWRPSDTAKTIAEVRLADDKGNDAPTHLAISIRAEVTGIPDANLTIVYPVAIIRYGNGGANFQRTVDCTSLGRTQVVASYVEVIGELRLPDGTVVPSDHALASTMQCKFHAEIAEGVDTELVPQSEWLETARTEGGSPLGVLGVPAKVHTINAYLQPGRNADAPVPPQSSYLLFFDRGFAAATPPPAPGDVPLFAIPLNVEAVTAAPWYMQQPIPNYRSFTHGIWIVVSSTANIYTAVLWNVAVDIEILRGQEV